MEQKGMGSRLFGSRTRLIIMTLGAGFAILIIRLFYLQVVQADMWKEKASAPRHTIMSPVPSDAPPDIHSR